MEDLFIWLYQLAHGVQDDPLWDEVYLSSGLLLILITIIVLVFYYHVLNRYFIDWFKLKHWFLFMFVNSCLVTGVTTIVAIRVIEPLDYTPEFLSFAIINFLYSAVFYTIFSLALCWGSPHAKYTPYKFYSKTKRD
jgi:hypothetical protein